MKQEESMKRKEKLVTGEIYHIFNKSIAGFKIFNRESEYLRMVNMLKYYQIENMPLKFSRFLESEGIKKQGFNKKFRVISANKDKLVEIIAYCLMPTHVHLVLKQIKDKGCSIFMGNLLNSYSRYFNTKYNRKGPLWVGKFMNVLVETNEELVHLTRYVHLNPVTANLVNKPEEWLASSYKEYIFDSEDMDKLCAYKDILDIKPLTYRKFVEDRASYQRELSKIKKLDIPH